MQQRRILFSIPRFTKCLFRGERDLYRRWFGAVETLMVLLYESYFGWPLEPAGRLRPQDYKRLFKHLTPEDSQAVDQIQPADGRPDLCPSFLLTVKWITRLYQQKGAQTGQSLDTRVAEYLLKFLEEEITRFQGLAAFFPTAEPA